MKKHMQEELELARLEKEVAGFASGVANAKSASDLQDILASLSGLAVPTTLASASLAEKFRGLLSYIQQTKAAAQERFVALQHQEAVEAFNIQLNASTAVGGAWSATENERLAHSLTQSLWRDPEDGMRKYFESINPNAEHKVERFDENGKLIEKPDGAKATVKGQQLRDDIALLDSYTQRDKLGEMAKSGDKHAQKALEEMNLRLYGHKDGLEGFKTAEEKAAAQKRAEATLKSAMENVQGHDAAGMKTKEEKEDRGRKLKEDKAQLEKVTKATAEVARLEEEKKKLPPAMAAVADQVIEEKKEELKREQKKLDERLAERREEVIASQDRQRKEFAAGTGKATPVGLKAADTALTTAEPNFDAEVNASLAYTRPPAPSVATAKAGPKPVVVAEPVLIDEEAMKKNATAFVASTAPAWDSATKVDSAKTVAAAKPVPKADIPGLPDLDLGAANSVNTYVAAVAPKRVEAPVVAVAKSAPKADIPGFPDLDAGAANSANTYVAAVAPKKSEAPTVAVAKAAPKADIPGLPDLDAGAANSANTYVAAVAPKNLGEPVMAVAKSAAKADIPGLPDLDAGAANSANTYVAAVAPKKSDEPVVALAAKPTAPKADIPGAADLDAMLAKTATEYTAVATGKKPEAGTAVAAKPVARPELALEEPNFDAILAGGDTYTPIKVPGAESIKTVAIAKPELKPEIVVAKKPEDLDLLMLSEGDIDAFVASANKPEIIALKDLAKAAVARLDVQAAKKEEGDKLTLIARNENIALVQAPNPSEVTPVRYEGPALPVNKQNVATQSSRL